MPFVAVGVEHKTSPLAVRERIALHVDDIPRADRELAGDPAIAEAVVLSTCNRTEAYLFADDVTAAAAVAAEFLAPQPSDRTHLQTWTEIEAIEHLFRVTAGLESQVLGEPQVLSQVSQALEAAQAAESTGPNLHALFRAAVSCARQARAGTALGRMDPSIATDAVRAVESALGTLEGRSVLVVGGGEIARLVAEELHRRRPATLFIANRSPEPATELAGRYGGRAAALTDIPRIVPHVQAIISVTGARHYVITPEDLESRPERLLIFDLAIPRDVDPSVAELPNVELHDLDSLLPAGLIEQWDEDVRFMEGVIAAEVHEFLAWYLTRRVVPVISNLRSHVEQVAENELKRVAPQLTGLSDRERAAVESLTQRLIDKMFHHLVMRLRLAAQTDPALVDAAEFFFLHGEGGLFSHATEEADTTSDLRT